MPYSKKMVWQVEIGDEFEPEFDALHEDVQTEILALSLLLQQFGPQLGRPRVDTLKGSRDGNMKELRFSGANGGWPSPSTRSVGRSCWWPATSPAAARSASTASSSGRRTSVSTPIWSG